MGWVVKQWRLDAIEELLGEAARADLAAARASADRDARRAHRAARRTAAAAEAELAALERLGEELRACVREWQAWRRLPDGPGAPVPTSDGEGFVALELGALPDLAAPAPAPPADAAVPPAPAAARPTPVPPAATASPPAPVPPAAGSSPPASAQPAPAASAAPPRRRPARASMHSSALTELFRATTRP
jgi:hypothetical protein